MKDLCSLNKNLLNNNINNFSMKLSSLVSILQKNFDIKYNYRNFQTDISKYFDYIHQSYSDKVYY